MALRRGLLLCGTEGGRILGFQCSGQFLILLFIDLFSILSNMFFYPSLLLHVQYRKGDRLINQQEAHVDEEFDGTAAVVG